MNYPIPGLTIRISAEPEINYLNYYESKIETSNTLQPVTNYEYEVLENEKKRKISILKRDYLPGVIADMRNIMKYSKSSQYIDNKNKKGFNPQFE